MGTPKTSRDAAALPADRGPGPTRGKDDALRLALRRGRGRRQAPRVRAVGRLREDLTRGTALEAATYRSGRDLKREVDDQIDRILRGEADITDSSDEQVSRVAYALMGGFEHTDGAFESRLELIDRAQSHSGVYMTVYPEEPQDSPRSF